MSRLLKIEHYKQFREVKNYPGSIHESVLKTVASLDERKELEPYILACLHDPNETPHGPAEIADILTHKLSTNTTDGIAAFIIKGKSFKAVKPKDVSHQIYRLKKIADLKFAVLAVTGNILDAAKEQFVNTAKGIRCDYSIFDRDDIARLLIAKGYICPNDGKPIKSGKCACGYVWEKKAVSAGDALPPIWKVPHGRNRNFTGREDLLAELRATLMSGEPAALTQAISGLGGVGKTQLALEYSYRHAKDYEIVWWVRAEEPATLAADYAALAGPLDLPEKEAREQEVVVKAVWQWLGRNSGWLLVFDNARDPDDVRAFIPQGTTGHVIITSRNPNWSRVAGTLTVKELESEKAVEFLLKRTGSTDKKAAKELAKKLGYLPLALEHAGAYIEAAGISLPDYLERYHTHKQQLLKNVKPSDDYRRTVAETFEISLQEVEKASPKAADLLNLCAFLAPDDIPLDILKKGAKHLPESLASVVADEIALDETVAALRRYSLVERNGANLSVHRLVQAVARDRLSEQDEKMWAEATVRVVNDVFPYESDDVRTWPECSRLLAHGLAATEHAEALTASPEATGRLLSQIGVYLHGRAEFSEAKELFSRALKIDEAAYGKNHPTVATFVSNLGEVLRAMGDLKGAKAHFERALKISEAAYGKNHPTVATFVNNLGVVLKAMDDLEGAKAHFERALEIGEAAYGKNHPTVANRVNNLGSVLQDLGNLKEAKAHFERAIKIDEVAHGKNHQEVATDVNNLGLVLGEMGDLQGAKTHFERALEIGEAAYGKNHPTVANRVNNLGSVLQDLGDLKGAKVHFERALRICQEFLAEDHPNTVKVRKHLEVVETLISAQDKSSRQNRKRKAEQPK